MRASLPVSAQLMVAPWLAQRLRNVAEQLPRFENQEFYSTELQTMVHDALREESGGLDSLIRQIELRLNHRPYCALVQGLSFDEGNKVFVGINRAFGELVARPYEAPRAQLVHYIQPATDIMSARGGHESERLHTDTADWEPPVELISMVCVRADWMGDGCSLVLDVDTIREEVREHLGPDVLRLLETEAVPWQLADYRGGGVTWRTILSESGVCWRRYTIDLALDSTGAKLSPEMMRALRDFEDVISNTPRTMEFFMRAGELLFSDNRRTIHARTPISEGAASERLMIRSWVRRA
jgi:hypothetical protein